MPDKDKGNAEQMFTRIRGDKEFKYFEDGNGNVTKKECSNCHHIKPIEEFNKNRRGWRGKEAECRDCKNEYLAQYRRNNKEYLREQGYKYYRENREYRLEYGRQHYKNNKERYKKHNRRNYLKNKYKREGGEENK